MKIDEVLRQFQKVTSDNPSRGARRWKARCPAHDDSTPSLSITEGKKRSFVKCWAGCDPATILSAAGISPDDVWYETKKPTPSSSPRPTVAALAIAKRLPLPFLESLGLRNVKNGIEVPYLHLDGTRGRPRVRVKMTGKNHYIWGGKNGIPCGAYALGLDQARTDGFTFIVEGESDLWTLRYATFHGIGLPGADTAKKVLPEHVKGIDTLYVVREPDRGGDTISKKIGPRLREIGWSGTARIITADGLKDISALWLDCGAELGHFYQRLQRAIDAGSPVNFEPDVDDATTATVTEQPTIIVGAQGLAETAEQAWAALKRMNVPPVVYRHGDVLVRVARDSTSGSPCLRVMTPDRMAHRLARVAEWVAADGNKSFKPAFPQPRVVADMLVDDDEVLPVLNRIATAPTFTPDGRLLEQPGFDVPSGILYIPPDGFKIPTVQESPTDEEVARARDLALEVFHDFPFVGEADRAAAVAALISGFARGLVAGNVPLIMFNKPTPRTGASLLTDVIGHIVLGHHMPKSTEAGSEEEWRKRITSILLETPPYVVLDNLRHRLDSGALSGVLTDGLWHDRILGVSKMVTLPARCMWLATANNPKVSTEMAGRIVSCRMDAKVERPGKRTGFLHDPLLDWVADRRADLIWAVCTMIRRWLSAGRPSGSEVLGGYESWCRVIGGVLKVAGIRGLLTNQEEFYSRADDEGRNIRPFLMAWWQRFGDKGAAVKDLLPLTEDVLDLGDKTDHSKRVRLGKMLSSEIDRRYTLEPDLTVAVGGAEDHHTKGFTWRLARVSPNTPQAPNTPHHTPQAKAPVNEDESGGLRSLRSLRSVFGESGSDRADVVSSLTSDSVMRHFPTFPERPKHTPPHPAHSAGGSEEAR